MSKEQWVQARETILTELIEDFHDKFGRYPTLREEEELEISITEDDMRDAVSAYSEDADER